MSEKKGSEMTRFVLSAPRDTIKRLKILAINLDKGFEKLGGELLDKAISEAEKEFERAKPKK